MDRYKSRKYGMDLVKRMKVYVFEWGWFYVGCFK